ncbi:MAG: sulfite exporter TauE/SafE family protein [Candidatus Thorarchaeota archaeon]|nr:MAG: sulfite exporter TauE/SafE family protein [Candidatus Thorarchaeota archaeon]RLI61187.1 MAG: sulfite exporter TauE/SafE family protein [Candidatus Thorarchaeota archaeon]
MDPLFMLALLITGAAVGAVSGMLGVGGCFIMIPVQYYVLVASGIDPTIAIRVSFGTNLLVVLPTAVSGAFRHNKKGAVLWRQAITLGVVGAASGFFGAFVASQLPGAILKVIFGSAILLGSLRMTTAKPLRVEGEVNQNMAAYVFWGIVLGFVTGLIGIGGGVLVVPVMVIFLNFHMHEAVGSSTAMMIFTSLGGALSYMILGLGVAGLPEFSIGYVNLLQWVLLAGTSIPMAQVGAHIAHKINAKALKWIFIVVMIYMALKMIGVFDLLGLPI